MYDLCVDTGDEVTQVTDEDEFEKAREPNTKFVMRVVLTEEGKRKDIIRREKFDSYTCPRCKKDTIVEQSSTSTSIDWYDLSIVGHDLLLTCRHATKRQ